MLNKVFDKILFSMEENKEYLISLDQKFGDGDLGLSMVQGFTGVKEYLKTNNEKDLGLLFRNISTVFNESAPSSLGTIISFFFMGMAKKLKGNESFTRELFADALKSGLDNLKAKTNAVVGQKTIVDSLEPAIEEFLKTKDYKKSLEAAKNGMEKTKDMMAVYGRAAYHKENTLGHIDGGSYVGYLIFEALYEEINSI